MDPNRFREAYARLQYLDETLTHRIRPRSGSLGRPNPDQLQEQVRDLAEYSVLLKEIVDELFQSIAAKPSAS